MAGPIAECRPTPRIIGGYLSGTATFGDWMVWSPGQSVENYRTGRAYVQQAPHDGTNWAGGAFMFAGILNRTREDETLEEGQTVNMISGGYCKRANVVGAAWTGAGRQLGIGNASSLLGVGQPVESVGGVYPDSIPIATALESYTTPGEEAGVACIVYAKQS